MAETPRYQLVRSLGKGGMGEVFLANDSQLQRQVAIKFLNDGAAEGDRLSDRLYREARSAAALDHPFICKIHEITTVGGRTGIVMEHVPGVTLQHQLGQTPLSPDRALEIAAEIAEALEEAHARRVIHRDLKPANVMVTAQGHVKVMDFGLAKESPPDESDSQTTGSLSDSGVRAGTPGYMSPEQLLGQPADERSDIFAFGVLVYELLAGVHPFKRASHSGTMAAILREPLPPVRQYASGLPDSVRLLLDRLLAKDARYRYQTFRDIRGDLAQLRAALQTFTPDLSAAEPGSGVVVRRTPYVGRETERSELRRVLDGAVDAHGGVVLLGGEPGVGKTRLTEELVTEARERGCLALTGHCYESEGTPPFIPFVEILERSARIVPRAAFREALGDAAPEVAKIMPELRRIFPDIPPPIELPPHQQRRFLFNAYQEFTERATRVSPIVTVLEDLHWADEPTLFLLQHQAQYASALPILIVGTYRDVELDVNRPFARVLESLLRERLAVRIALRRLSAADVEVMLQGLAGGMPPPPDLAKAVYQETEGNPFFIEEVFQHLSEEGRLFDADGRWRRVVDAADLQVPEGVRLVIGRRLERVGEETRRALTTAAVIGRHFDLSVLEQTIDLASEALLDALEEAERMQLVTSAPSGRDIRYTFAHELIRQTLHTNLSLPRRQRLHLRVAEAIEAAHPELTTKEVPALAHHYYQAGAAADAGKAQRYATEAGQQALAAGAFEDAVTWYTTALSFDTPDDHQADLLFDRGRASRSLAHADDAIADWEAALLKYRDCVDENAMARTAWDLGFAFVWQDRRAEMLRVAESTERVVAKGNTPERTRILALLGGGRGFNGDYEGAISTLGEARRIAERLGDQALLGQILDLQAAVCWNYGKIAHAVEAGEDASHALRTTTSLWTLAESLSILCLSLALAGRPEEAQAAAEETERLGLKVGHDGAVAQANATRAHVVAMRKGDLGAFHEAAQAVLHHFKRAGPWGFAGHLYLSVGCFWKGEWDEADRWCGEALDEHLPQFWAGWAHAWHYVLQAYRGDRACLDACRHRVADLRQGTTVSFHGDRILCTFAPDVFTQLGERQEAHRLYRTILGELEDGHVSLIGAPVEMYAGIAAAAGEQWDAAQGHFTSALRFVDALPMKIGQPEVRRSYADMLLHRNQPGDRDKARTLLGEATDLYRAIGMPKHLELVEQMSAQM